MVKKLPLQIDPIHLCDASGKLEGEIPLSSMSRIVSSTVSAELHVVKVSLQFYRERQQGFRGIRGKIYADLPVVCQRCLQGMVCKLELDVNLVLVFNESQMSQVPKGFDALIVTNEPMELAEVIEEEILLSLPIVPKHDKDDCPGDIKNF